jgi:monovalent cation:H+ antiporter-2, CPA2 family
MIEQPLTQVLIMLAASVFVVALARRIGWPSILGYLVVGMALGPHALRLITQANITSDLAELGVVFLLFTLGLEFSLPRMMAVRREVFGLGALQVGATIAVIALIGRGFGLPWLIGSLVGGALAMSSTAIVLHTLTDRGEINRTHGRLAFSMLLFQDMAFVPLLALVSALAGHRTDFSAGAIAVAVAGGAAAVAAVLAAGRWLLRPLFHEIAHSRLRELFTLAVLLVVLASAWTSYLAGLSLAMGAFLAGMMLAETEYRHQIESVIRPFRDILLGLFFISVGMLLDLYLLVTEFVLISALLVGFLVVKAAVAALATRLYEGSTFKAVRTGIVMSIGGEFGVALFTLILQSGAVPVRIAQALLVAVVLSMIISPFILANNARIARFVLREKRPQADPPGSMAYGPAGSIAQREHVILCGYGRVGQSVARVLESQGFEYIALDLDPARIRAARQAGEPVLYGDSADEDMLVSAGCDHASAVVVSFSSPGVALAIVRTVRRLRAEVPILVRTVDDTRAAALLAAGATQIIPETFEMGLILVGAALRALNVPAARVAQALGQVRDNRYVLLRNVRPHTDSPVPAEVAQREEVRTVVIPPGAWAVGRSVEEVRTRGAAVAFTGIRRHGILGTAPAGATRLREGDIVLIHGRPEALEHAEGVLLAG